MPVVPCLRGRVGVGSGIFRRNGVIQTCPWIRQCVSFGESGSSTQSLSYFRSVVGSSDTSLLSTPLFS